MKIVLRQECYVCKLDESISSLSRLGWGLIFCDESFSSLSRLGGGLIFLDESFSSLSRLGWGLTSRFGFLNSKGFRKLKERTWHEGQGFSRLGWSLIFFMSHFHVSQDLDEVWHPVLGFWIRKNSGNLRKGLDKKVKASQDLDELLLFYCHLRKLTVVHSNRS